MFVVFTSTEEFHISAVYMGGVPLAAEHDNMPPCNANQAAGYVIIGGTNWLEIKKLYRYCSFTEPYLLTLILNKLHLAVIQATVTSKRGLS